MSKGRNITRRLCKTETGDKGEKGVLTLTCFHRRPRIVLLSDKICMYLYSQSEK
jgi:hypothetical protein